MNIQFKLNGTKEIKKLYVRFYHNKLDAPAFTGMMLTDSEWISATETVIGNNEVTIALQSLKIDILKQYNKDFCNGILIDKVWLQKVVKVSFMRPKEENGLVSPDYSVYVSDFATWWLKNHSAKWKVSARKFMEEPAKKQYEKFVETLVEYEKVIGEKLQIRNTNKDNIFSFIDWLETENYQTSTIERNIGRLRFFLNRATEMNYEVNPIFKERIYFAPDNDIEGVYLNEIEIQKIIDKDFSDDDELNVAKQNFLLGLHTGLRVSDFLKLDTKNIADGNFVLKTKKTQAKVVIPIHPVVENIMNDNFGYLPQKISSSEFNKRIKTICQVCEIDNLVYGKVFDKDLKRKKVGYFEKYLLISSHVCRRSYATNFSGAGIETLNSVMGWSKNSKMATKYNKTSKIEYAEQMKQQWKQ